MAYLQKYGIIRFALVIAGVKILGFRLREGYGFYVKKRKNDEGGLTAMFESMKILDSTAQHSTAQHSTAQHSTAQHSTAQADCAVFYKRILRSIKHVLSDELSDGACFYFMGTNRGVPNRCNTGV